MRKIPEIEKSVESVTTLDESTIGLVVLQVPQVLSQLIKDLRLAEVALSELMATKKNTERELRKYLAGQPSIYDGKRPPVGFKVPLSAMNSFIATDKEMVALDMKLDKLKAYVNFVENAVKTVNTVQWIAKIYVDRNRAVI